MDRTRVAGARVSGAPYGIHRVQGAPSASRGESGPRHHAERGRSAHFPAARQARQRRCHPQPAGPGLPPRRSKARVTSSISRRLIFWLAVPLMLLALCGALMHYFNSIAPGVINSDRRLKDATNALMAHVQAKDGQIALDTNLGAGPTLPTSDSIRYALRDPQGRLLGGDAQIPVVPLTSANAQLFAMAQIDGRSRR